MLLCICEGTREEGFLEEALHFNDIPKLALVKAVPLCTSESLILIGVWGQMMT